MTYPTPSFANIQDQLATWTARTLSGNTMEFPMDTRHSPVGLYDAIIRAAWCSASAADRRRIAELQLILNCIEGLRDGASTELELARSAYITHLLTGPAMLNTYASTTGEALPNDTVDALLDWRQFRSHPETRRPHLGLATRSPISPLLRTTAETLLLRFVELPNCPIGNTVQSLMSQIARLSASGATAMVDTAVSCLIPPVN